MNGLHTTRQDTERVRRITEAHIYAAFAAEAEAATLLSQLHRTPEQKKKNTQDTQGYQTESSVPRQHKILGHHWHASWVSVWFAPPLCHILTLFCACF